MFSHEVFHARRQAVFPGQMNAILNMFYDDRCTVYRVKIIMWVGNPRQFIFDEK